MSETEASAARPRTPERILQAGRALGGAALHMLFPPRCLCCGERVASDFGLCPPCWADAAFIEGARCDRCGAGLPGEPGPDEALTCDDCLRIERPWTRGRCALTYSGTGRTLALALKHGDRLDLARPLGAWLARAAADLAAPGVIVAPVPLHRLRLIRRRYNQSALLAAELARAHRLTHIPDLLTRLRRTPSQDGRDPDARFANLAGAIDVTARRRGAIVGKTVLVVDDVMTSGATLSACAEALTRAGAAEIRTAALTRVVKDA